MLSLTTEFHSQLVRHPGSTSSGPPTPQQFSQTVPPLQDDSNSPSAQFLQPFIPFMAGERSARIELSDIEHSRSVDSQRAQKM